jgi:hypothetical protein
MNEQELRDGLRNDLVASSPPPSMNPTTALDAARLAHRRRRARWAGTGAAVAVVALAAGAVLTLSRPDPTGILPLDMGAAPGGTADTKPSLPNGQTDRTARSGPRAKKGDQLLQALVAALPDTLTVNTKTQYPGSDTPVTAAQVQFVDRAGDKEIWEYLATAAVNTKTAPTGGTGRVLVAVHTVGNTDPADVCKLAQSFWGVGGACEVRDVQGKKVGVLSKADDERIDQVAAYRYDDGTTVVVAQSKAPDNAAGLGRETGGTGMAQPPLTLDQLAALAPAPAFKIS